TIFESSNDSIHRPLVELVQDLLVHVPLPEDGENRPGAESRAHQMSKNTRGLPPVRRFLQTLATQVLARLSFFVHFGERGLDGFLNYLAVNALDLQIGDHPPPSQF